MSAMREPQARLHAPVESDKQGGATSLLESVSHLATVEPAPIPGRRACASLAVETGAVTLVVVAAIRFLSVQSALELKWLLIPCLLVVAALLPTWLRGRQFPPVGLDGKRAVASLVLVCLTCICAVPAVLLGLRLMTWMHLPIPLKPAVADPGGWAAWLIYQFLYVAVGEEVFFRGYVQVNVMNWLGDRRRSGPYVAMVASAGCFALAHVVVQGQTICLVTFLPGLVLAWLFLRTRSLLAPILFHGLANVSYGVIALTVT
jgi:membrane protease YdiL (CAAX protease family)